MTELLPLTPNQFIVLKKIASDKSIKEIAFEMNMSPKTIEYHWTQLKNKLRVRSYVGAAHYALKNNIVKFIDFAV